jgi:hypothetical protein
LLTIPAILTNLHSLAVPCKAHNTITTLSTNDGYIFTTGGPASPWPAWLAASRHFHYQEIFSIVLSVDHNHALIFAWTFPPDQVVGVNWLRCLPCLLCCYGRRCKIAHPCQYSLRSTLKCRVYALLAWFTMVFRRVLTSLLSCCIPINHPGRPPRQWHSRKASGASTMCWPSVLFRGFKRDWFDWLMSRYFDLIGLGCEWRIMR